MPNRSRFDADEPGRPPTGEDLDHTPLTLGKYVGRTPDWVAERDPGYLVWLYENVTNRPTCSRALYRAAKQDERDSDTGPEYPDGSPVFGPGDLA